MTRHQLIELIDSDIRIDYYISLFIGNTISLMKDEINVEMVAKIGKFLREIKSKPKRERIFTGLANKIRNVALSFTPLTENPEFIEIWTQLIEYGLQ